MCFELFSKLHNNQYTKAIDNGFITKLVVGQLFSSQFISFMSGAIGLCDRCDNKDVKAPCF